MSLWIELEDSGLALRSLFAGQEGHIADTRETQPGVVLRRGREADWHAQPGEPHLLKMLLEFTGRISDFGGTAAVLVGAAKTTCSAWIKINGKRYPADETAVKEGLEGEQSVFRLSDD